MCTLVVRESEMGRGDGGGDKDVSKAMVHYQGTQDFKLWHDSNCRVHKTKTLGPLCWEPSTIKGWSGSEYSSACFTIYQDSDFPLKPSLKFTIFQHNVTCMHVNSQVNQNFTCDLMTVFHTKWPSHIYVIVYQESVNQAVELS